MTSYQTIEKLFYQDASADRFARTERLAQERLEADSSFRTGVKLKHGELFLAVPRELSLAHEQVLRKERRVSALWRQLPLVALAAYVRSLIADEVVYSNEIEGVRSTRRQIKEALDTVLGSDPSHHAPFVEFARLYLGLTERGAVFPRELEDIRAIYDAVVGDTVPAENRPEGALFRRDEVEIYNDHGKMIHVGAAPERIQGLLREVLRIAHWEDIPEVYAAALCHFLFEYIHPFYDGNGRTGRYLLALQLAEALSQPTVLSLSRVIAENKATYYKAFQTVEKPLNHSEATPFALMLCDLLLQAQDALIADLEDKRERLDRAHDAIERTATDCDTREHDVLYYAAQRHLFDLYREVRSIEIAAHLGVSPAVARRTLKGLEARGFLRKTAGRPLTYVLSDEGARLLDLDGE